MVKDEVLKSVELPRHLPAIDMLRGLAATAVLLFHLLLIPEPHLKAPEWLVPYLMKGGTGVILFFVISSFTLCLSWDLRREERFARRSFFLRRFFRISPLFYTMLAVFLVRDYLFYGKIYSISDISLNITFLYNLVPGKHESIVWAGWTLGIEMIFYFLFPFLQWARRSLFSSITFFLCTSLISFFWRQTLDSSNSYGYMSIINHLPVFAVGFIVYDIVFRVKISKLFSLLFVLIWGALFFLKVDTLIPTNVLTQWQALCMGILVLGMINFHRVSVIFSELGRVSYSLYLVHPLLIWGLRPLYRIIEGWGFSFLGSFLICLSITGGLIYLLSLATFKWIENPGVEYGKRIVVKLNEGRSLRGIFKTF